MRRLFFFFFVLLGTTSVFAQNPPLETEGRYAENNSDDNDTLYEPESWDVDLDSLMNAWYVKYYVDKNAHPGYQEAIIGSDSVYVDRLSRLNSVIELPYNRVVRNCIDLYVDRRRATVEYMLGLENFYFPMIEEALDLNGLPLELKYLTIVESALNPAALSRAGASGLWQFMLGTGKQYGLEVNSLVDERRDPLKATYAACEYLKDLYRIYGDWTLALAAYNCGPGNVNKAIKRANGSTDYWQIYPYLPKETRSYVPLFIAATYVMNYYANHQLYPVKTNMPIVTDTVMVTQNVHFDQIAEILNVEKDLIRALNPQYKRDIVPGSSQPRAIKLPVLQAYAFIEKEDSIVNYRKNELFANRMYVDVGGDNGGGDGAVATTERILHRVKKGEDIRKIAARYSVSIASIRKWNQMKSNRLTAGARLVIYRDNGGYASNSAITTSSSSPSREAIQAAIASVKMQGTASESGKYGTYKVKVGDSLYSIAKRYPNCSLFDLMRINNMEGNPEVVEGQIIRVPKI
ncbi:MAG: transglycosylase SLT domain-containing protein [Candidatus Azobacteroides sp.]|nr:transglycosylase SLT domain-containing protein [Candidatus Azobacteroides sp.]